MRLYRHPPQPATLRRSDFRESTLPDIATHLLKKRTPSTPQGPTGVTRARPIGYDDEGTGDDVNWNSLQETQLGHERSTPDIIRSLSVIETAAATLAEAAGAVGRLCSNGASRPPKRHHDSLPRGEVPQRV